MNPVQGSCRNSVMRRLPIPIFGVLRKLIARYVFLVLLEKPADKDRKSKFPNKALTNKRPNDSSPKNTKKAKVLFLSRKPVA